MGRHCCVTSCRSYSASGRTVNGLSFFKFPTWKQTEGGKVSEITRRRRRAWVSAVGRPDITFTCAPASMKVCALHFHSGKPAYEMFESHPDWAPSLNMGPDVTDAPETERSARHTKRQRFKTEGEPDPTEDYTEPVEYLTEPEEYLTEQAENFTEPAEYHTEPAEYHTEPAEYHTEPVEYHTEQAEDHTEPASIVVELTEEAAGETDGGLSSQEQIECEFCGHRRAEIKRLLKENRELKCALAKRNMDEESLTEDDAKVKYYTGLPCFGLLMSLLSTVMPCLPTSVRTVSRFQMLFLTLMRMRLNLPLQHLAYIFQVDKRVVVTVFNTTVHALHARLSPLVRWPSRENLRQNMPPQFVKAFGDRVVVILDIFEIFAERTSNLRALSLSSKNGHSVKYLMGLTPHGAISFISKGWGGHVSDEHVTQNSGVLDALSPGDLLLAERGSHSAGMTCAEVKATAGTQGRCQLDVRDGEETRRIAPLRSHVTRMTGAIRNTYTMLHGPVPEKMSQARPGEELTFLDKLVMVCCVLTSMRPGGGLGPSLHCTEPV